MICTPITASSTKEALKDIEKADADLIELRLDFIKDINEKNLERLLKNKKKIIVTDRKKRLNLIKKAVMLKADFIDVDISIGEKAIKDIINNKKKTKLIISFHNFKKTDKKEINNKFEKIKRLNPDIIKIAVFANDINDNLVIFDLIRKAKKQKKKIIALCMGEKGRISRILSPIFGAELTYGSLRKGKESAPGQLTAAELKNVFRINKLNNPKIVGLVGNPVEHSKAILVYNKAFDRLKLNNIYLNFLVDDLNSFIKNFKGLISGLSITIPYKRKIMKHLDKIDPISKKIGAVNTIIKKNGRLIGYNTDITGAIKAIKTRLDIKNKNVLLIGAGGAARAIAFGIKKQKGNLIIVNRTAKKAKKLANELKCEYGGLNKIKNQKNIDLIINGTSVGMFPNIKQTIIKKNILKKIIKKRTAVFDSVYTPANTQLLKDAKASGCRIISGTDMFINQADQQFRLFTGKRLK